MSGQISRISARRAKSVDTVINPEMRLRMIKDAAIKQIKKYGMRKVSVDDITDAAGISRRTFYRFFDSKQAIIEALIVERMAVLGEKVKARIRSIDSFEEAIVIGTLETVRLAQQDEVYNALAGSGRELFLELPHKVPDAPLRTIFKQIWESIIREAANNGLLRPGISVAEAEDWLMDVHYLLSLRIDLDDASIVSLLRKLVLASLIPDAKRINDPQAGAAA